MDFYHIDRLKRLSSTRHIQLHKLSDTLPELTISDKKILETFNYELSQHGIVYLSQRFDSKSSFALSAQIELAFEFVRQLYFPQKLSRFQSMFAFKESNGWKSFPSFKKLPRNSFNIVLLETDYYEEYDASWLHSYFNVIERGQTCEKYSNSYIISNAFSYWSGEKSSKPQMECLLKCPVTVNGIFREDILPD